MNVIWLSTYHVNQLVNKAKCKKKIYQWAATGCHVILNQTGQDSEYNLMCSYLW